MVNTYSVAYGKTVYKQKGEIQEWHPDCDFPDSRPSFIERWMHFVNYQHWMPAKHSGIYSKHFEENTRVTRGGRG